MCSAFAGSRVPSPGSRRHGGFFAAGRKLRDQLLRRARRFAAAAERVEHRLQVVQRLLRGVEVPRLQRGLAGARLAQGVLGGVAQLDHGVDRQESGAALERVEPAEHGIELFAVLGRMLQRHQLLAEPIQDFLGLDDEVGSDVVGHGAHRITTLARTADRRRRSATRRGGPDRPAPGRPGRRRVSCRPSAAGRARRSPRARGARWSPRGG